MSSEATPQQAAAVDKGNAVSDRVAYLEGIPTKGIPESDEDLLAFFDAVMTQKASTLWTVRKMKPTSKRQWKVDMKGFSDLPHIANFVKINLGDKIIWVEIRCALCGEVGEMVDGCFRYYDGMAGAYLHLTLTHGYGYDIDFMKDGPDMMLEWMYLCAVRGFKDSSAAMVKKDVIDPNNPATFLNSRILDRANTQDPYLPKKRATKEAMAATAARLGLAPCFVPDDIRESLSKQQFDITLGLKAKVKPVGLDFHEIYGL